MNKIKCDILLIDIHRRYYDNGLNYPDNLGLYYLASYAGYKNFDAKVVCCNPGEIENLIEEKISIDALVVIGFYCDYDNVFDVKELSNKLKSRYKKIKIVIGGPQALFLSNKIIIEAKCDYVVIGDGEHTLVELLDYIKYFNGNIKNISGLFFVENGVVNKNKCRMPNNELDLLPFPDKIHSLTGNFRVNEKITILASRGCTFSCAFCFENINSKIRYRSIKNVFDEITQIAAENDKLKCIIFIDSNFTTTRERLKDVCENFRNFNKKLAWICEAHIKFLLKNEELIDEMLECGLFRIQVGLESGVNRILSIYNKNINIDEIEAFLELCKNKNVPQIVTNIIIGGALETTTTFYKTLALVENLMKKYPGMIDIYSSYLFPYPGTEITNNPEKYEIKIVDENSYTSMSDYPVLETFNLDKKKIFELKQEFDSTIINLMRQLKSKLKFEDILKHFKGYAQYNIKSLWYEILSEDYYLKNFMGLITSGNANYSKYISANELLNYKPIRTMNINSFVWDGGLTSGDIKLTEEETVVFEYCAGKLNVKEIVNKMNTYYNDTDKFIFEKTLNILKKLEEQYLLAFCK